MPRPGTDPINSDFLDLLRAFDDADVRFLVVGAREELLRNKRAAGRPKDFLDIELLEGSAKDPSDSSSET